MKILKLQNYYNPKEYLAISILGKSYKLKIKPSSSNSINLIKKNSHFTLVIPKKYINDNIQKSIEIAVKKLYSEIAPSLIEDSLELARFILKFAPEDYKIERINNAFYKTIDKRILIINPDIVKYNKEIINTSMIQEFCKLKYNSNSKLYKSVLKNALNNYEKYKKEIIPNNNFKTGTFF